jgi:glycosyltransferase involved in cell wall biosynthesis
MITICIPTFNRSKFLQELLQSIYNANQKIPIVLSNNNSTDDTNKVIQIYKKKLTNFTSIQQKKNIGFARNYLECIFRVRTKYAWVVGDDDLLKKDSIKNIIFTIKKLNYPNGIIFEYDNFLNQSKNKSHNSISEISLLKDFSKCGLISTQIIKVENVKLIKNQITKQKRNLYIQIYIMLHLIKKFGKWYKSSKKIINYRNNNFNHYSEKWILKRLENEIRGYLIPLKIIYNKQSTEYKSITNLIFNKNIISWILYATIQVGKLKTLLILKNNFKYFHLELRFKFFFICLVLFILPKRILSGLPKIKIFLS